MAIITTALTPLPRRVPIIGALPDQSQWITQIPKAEIIFATNGVETITLAGVGDTQRLTVICTLPPGFAYAYMEGYVQLRETVAGDLANWDDTASCFLSADSNFGADWVWFFNMRKPAVGSISGGSVTLTEAVYTPENPNFKKVIVPQPGADPELTFAVSNVSTNDAAMTSNFFFRFLQFDLNQGHFWAVNTPVVVR